MFSDETIYCTNFLDMLLTEEDENQPYDVDYTHTGANRDQSISDS